MTKADILEAWGNHLAQGRRRSAHTVRAYVATAARLIGEEETGWPTLARLDAPALRQHLASRRAGGIGNKSAARELSALKSFIAFARDDGGTFFSAFHQRRKGVQDEFAIRIIGAVAVDAVGVPKRGNLLRVVHGLGVGGGEGR